MSSDEYEGGAHNTVLGTIRKNIHTDERNIIVLSHMWGDDWMYRDFISNNIYTRLILSMITRDFIKREQFHLSLSPFLVIFHLIIC